MFAFDGTEIVGSEVVRRNVSFRKESILRFIRSDTPVRRQAAEHPLHRWSSSRVSSSDNGVGGVDRRSRESICQQADNNYCR
jgi:hypothetical protein